MCDVLNFLCAPTWSDEGGGLDIFHILQMRVHYNMAARVLLIY